MKKKWKLFIFGKRKRETERKYGNESGNLQNGNFMQKQKQNRNGFFLRNKHENGSFHFHEYGIFRVDNGLCLLCILTIPTSITIQES